MSKSNDYRDHPNWDKPVDWDKLDKEQKKAEKLRQKIAKYESAMEKHRRVHGNKWMTRGPTDPDADKSYNVHGAKYEEYKSYWGCDASGWVCFHDEKKFPASQKLARFLDGNETAYGEVRTALFIDDVYQETAIETVVK